jgi:hypothetical protein
LVTAFPGSEAYTERVGQRSVKVLDLKIGLEPRAALAGVAVLVCVSGVLAVAPTVLRSAAKVLIKTGIRVHRAWTKAPAPPTRRVKEGRKGPGIKAGRARPSSASLTAERREACEQFADFVAAVSRRGDLDKTRKGQMIHDKACELTLIFS